MKIFDWLYYFKVKFKNSRINDHITPIRTTQENPRDAKAVKEFNNLFEAQQAQARSMAAHERDCPIIDCTGCFKRIPDKIVGKPQQVESADSVLGRKKRFKFVGQESPIESPGKIEEDRYMNEGKSKKKKFVFKED